jgi:hypothetical protein
MAVNVQFSETEEQPNTSNLVFNDSFCLRVKGANEETYYKAIAIIEHKGDSST